MSVLSQEAQPIRYCLRPLPGCAKYGSNSVLAGVPSCPRTTENAANNEGHDAHLLGNSQWLSDDVMIRTAPNPEGRWSREGTLFTAKAPLSGNVYDARAHSECDLNGGQTIFVTYSRATGAFSSEVRPVSVELQQPRLGS